MYVLFIANKNYSSWSLRPWVLMKECGIPFEERAVSFENADNWDAFRAFAPNGQVPCLHDGETVVWETIGIVEYLAERHAGVWPETGAARAWTRCATAEMHAGFSTLRNRCGMNCGVRVELIDLSPGLRRDIARIDELWREGLDRHGGPFLAGDRFTAVDAFFAPVAFRIQSYGLELSGAALAYAQRLVDRPAMQEWYRAALADPYRESSHEQDLAASGRIVADLRRVAI